MIPKYQEGKTDCIRACLASLLHLETKDIPDFSSIQDDKDADIQPWWVELQAFCRKHGYFFLELRLTDKKMPWMPLVWDAYCMLMGPTPPNGVQHAIIGKCVGGKLAPVHDPRGPEFEPGAAFIERRVYHVCFLVPLDPALLKLEEKSSIIA